MSAQDYEDTLTQLWACGVIPAEVHDQLKGLGGFRNILLHGYLRLDPGKVADLLARAPALGLRARGARLAGYRGGTASVKGAGVVSGDEGVLA